MSAATAQQEHVADTPRAGDPYAAVCELVDRQQAALAAELPEMVHAAGMRPVEMWFVWGALSEMLDDDVGRVEQALSSYLRRRHRRAAGPADEMASAVRQACTVSNALVDGMVLAGRHMVSRGIDNRCFLAAALFLRYAHTQPSEPSDATVTVSPWRPRCLYPTCRRRASASRWQSCASGMSSRSCAATARTAGRCRRPGCAGAGLPSDDCATSRHECSAPAAAGSAGTDG